MQYFLFLNGAQAGPFTWDQVKAKLADKSITPETLYWKEGQADWQPLSTLGLATASEAQPVAVQARIFSGFWRRVAALLVDFIILAIFGNILGILFFNFFCSLGFYGPLVGLPFAWIYFGIQSSELCQGKTLGKRLLGIEVVKENGSYISVARSFLRYALWGVPYFLSSVLVGLLGISTTAMLVGMIFLTWFWLIIYLLIFNRPSRRVLHDLLLRTYVVKSGTTGAVVPVPLWKGHLIAIGVFVAIGCAACIGGGILYKFLEKGPLAELFDLQKAVAAKPDVQAVSVMAGKNFVMMNGSTTESTNLTIQATWNGRPNDVAAAAREIAAVVVDKGEKEAGDKDGVVIVISYGYNIGIASGSISQRYVHTLSEWQSIVQKSGTP